MKMRTFAIGLLLAAACAQGARAAEGSDEEQACRGNLAKLADAVKAYREAHAKTPAQLSDLYYLSYADDVALYRCPTSGGGRLRRTEIDQSGDYTTEPLAGQTGILVRERTPHHGGNKVLAAMEDGSIQALPVGGGSPLDATNPIDKKDDKAVDSGRQTAEREPVKPIVPPVEKKDGKSTAETATADAATGNTTTADRSTVDASTADRSTADRTAADRSTASVATGDKATRDDGPVVMHPQDDHEKPRIEVARIDPNKKPANEHGEGPVIVLEDPDHVFEKLPPGAVVTRSDQPGVTKIPGADEHLEQGTREDKARERTSAAVMRDGGGFPGGAMGGMEIGANDSVAMADMLYGRGGYDAAIDFYERALAADPKNEQALLGHARASIRTGALTAARQQLQKVLTTNPGQVEARRLSATIDLALGDVKHAVTTANALYHKNPNDPEVALLHAQSALYAGDEAEARKRFETLARAYPNASAEHLKLADEYRDARFLKLAELEYATAWALNPADDEALLGLGMAATHAGHKDRGARALDEYLRRYPNSADSADVKAELQKLNTGRP